jgi:hypothetical protein
VIRELNRICRSGYNLGTVHNMRRDRRLYEAARRHFGTWKRALCSIGVELKRVNNYSKRRRLDKENILADARARHDAGCSMRWSRVCVEDRALAIAAKNAFIGWRRALLAAGLVDPVKPTVTPRKWDAQRVVKGIRQRWQEGKPLHHKAVSRDDGGLVSAARRYSGGWDEAIVAAGLEPPCVVR